MQYLIYVSASVKLLNNAEIKEILEVSRANNKSNNITGMLLYSEGTFMQVLEGEEEALTAAFKRIEKDRRHTGVVKLAQTDISERLFPNQPMGFKTASTRHFNKFSDFVPIASDNIYPEHSLHPAVSVLREFIESHGLLTVLPVISFCLPRLFR